MSENQLRWIAARVDDVREVNPQQMQIGLFLPSFARFIQLPEQSVIDVKTPSGLIREYPIVAIEASTQTITIEVIRQINAAGESTSLLDGIDLDQIIEISAPRESHKLTQEDIDFYVTFARKGVTIAIPKEMSIADAMREHHLTVNTSCEYGVCGTCYATVLSGEILHEDTYLTEEEKSKQDCMMICVSRAKPGTTIVLDL
ncbi:ferredoxin [Pelistega indica]|uniref:Ferredoxin n=1 Tax=Pelistega indica TaxID=1414851 RepID=V8FSE7_9BURK|nr:MULTISPECIES: 2Fe-2S iron-sulfur cluster binding domain-containing protein [Pelistega]ETD67224.1 ferredoxin [Pelistega indica]